MKSSGLWIACLVVMFGCSPYGKVEFSSQSSPLASEGGGAPPNMIEEPFKDDSRKWDRAWQRSDTAIVIDAFQGNSIDWDKMAGDARVAAVIHRCTIGQRVDSAYASRQVIARSRGYLWGAYHLGDRSDPIVQAKLFLATVGDFKDVLLVLDLEDTSSSSMMDIDGAQKFMQYVFEQTGKVPVVYANHSVTQALNSSLRNSPLFQQARLWYARFRSNIPDFPVGIWSTYFLWQFSSEINCSKTGSCLYNVPGTLFDMDVNVYYGTRAALEQEWNL